MRARKVFISYSRLDYSFVQQVSSAFNRKLKVTWIDRNFIKPGDIWRDQIETALKDCYCVFFFASTASVKSEEVKKEIDYAIHLKKKSCPNFN